MNVNVNVHIGGAAQQRPQWFGDRPKKGRFDRGDYNGERDDHIGGKHPRPDWRDEDSSEESEHNGGKRPRPPRPEKNGSR